MLIRPKVDPKGKAYRQFSKGYKRFVEISLILLVLVHWITVAWALGIQLPIDRIVKIGVSLLFLVIGNYLGQIRLNYTFGIKIPWILASKTVWTQTHRVSSYAFVLSGLVMLVLRLLEGR